MEKYMFLFVGGDASHLSNEALAHRELTAQEACKHISAGKAFVLTDLMQKVKKTAISEFIGRRK